MVAWTSSIKQKWLGFMDELAVGNEGKKRVNGLQYFSPRQLKDGGVNN